MQSVLSVEIADLETVNWQQKPVKGLHLSDAAVHVWRICISQHLDEISNLKKLLTPEETERGNKYVHQADRDRFAISRGYQRIILSGYVNIEPGDLRFTLGHNKKPYIANSGAQHLNHNVSHSGDWILIAVAKYSIGCDVEHIDPKFEFADILPYNFSIAERDFINQKDSINRFYKLWTRKEALLKATGQGLGDHLINTPSLDGTSKLNPDMLGTNTGWTVNSFAVNEGYAGALAFGNIAPAVTFFNV